MKNQETTPLEFIYNEMQIHFLINPTDKNVMINATEMGKMFGKKTGNYLINKSTKDLISELKRTGMSVHLDEKIIDDRGRNGIYFCEVLALDFAAWLDVKFRLWIYKTIRDLLTKETKIVKKSISAIQEAEVKLQNAIEQVKRNGDADAIALLEALREKEVAKKNKTKAMNLFSKQLSMDM